MGSRQIVTHFVSTCQSAATCDMWTCITTLCDGPDSALLQLKYGNLWEISQYWLCADAISA